MLSYVAEFGESKRFDALSRQLLFTEAQAREELRITAVAPAGSHDPIRYVGAVLKTSRDSAAAEAYLRSLAHSAARESFLHHGFGGPAPSSQP